MGKGKSAWHGIVATVSVPCTSSWVLLMNCRLLEGGGLRHLGGGGTDQF